MSVKFFGQFLLERGVINREQLLDAIKVQEKHNRRLGDYAVSRGFLTKENAQKINISQLSEDRPFGEIAIDSGLINSAQLSELLVIQKNDHIQLGEALIENNLDRDIVERELRAFEADQAGYIVDDIVFPPGIKNASLLACPVDLGVKMLRRITGIRGKIGEGEKNAYYPVERLFSANISISGCMEIDFTISVSVQIAANIASALSGENVSTENKSELSDGIKEMCNIICGNSAAKIAKAGHKIEISSPEEGPARLSEWKNFVLFPVHLPHGAMEMRFSR